MSHNRDCIDTHLQKTREILLDLTLRNGLLSFQTKKRSSIRIIDEISRELFDIVVQKRKKMRFLPQDDSSLNAEQTLKEEAKPADRHTDQLLQTELAKKDLQVRMTHIYRQAKTIFEEQGYSVLYLALGFLHWKENGSAQKLSHAPLVLIPVELKRKKVSAPFELTWNEAELSPNISLEKKLTEQDIELPDFKTPENKEDIESYFEEVKDAVSVREEWCVKPNEIYLGFFNFTKLVMYNDLDLKEWPNIKNHPLLKSIFGESEGVSEARDFEPKEIDRKLPSESMYHVMDADSSQATVIEEVKRGKNLVVEGPPGTGKSQTITNIIAELLAANKKVLFVSEKMAALEVVKKRLDDVNLGDFCLELHSYKSNKQALLNELEKSASRQEPHEDQSDSIFKKLDDMKSKLNSYVKEVHEPVDLCKKSPYMLFSIIEDSRRHFDRVGRQVPDVDFTQPAAELSADGWEVVEESLKDLEKLMKRVMPIVENPWRGCKPNPAIRPEKVSRLINECQSKLQGLIKEAKYLVDTCGLSAPNTLDTLPKLLSAANVMANSISVDQSILLGEAWSVSNGSAEEAIQKVDDAQKDIVDIKEKFTVKFITEILKMDQESMARQTKDYESRANKLFWLRIFDNKFRRITTNLRRDCYQPSALSPKPNQIIDDLKQLVHYRSLQEDLKRMEKSAHTLFGKYWQGEKSDVKQLQQLAKWIVEFRKHLQEGTLTEKSVDIVNSKIPPEQTSIIDKIKEVKTKEEIFVNQYDALLKQLSTDAVAIFGMEISKVSLVTIQECLYEWQKGCEGDLQKWMDFLRKKEECQKTILQPFVEKIETLEPEDLHPCFNYRLSDALLNKVFSDRTSLSSFVHDLHEGKVRDFRQLDEKSIELNRKRLSTKLLRSRPSFASGASRNSEQGILEGQFNRKRGHMSIRNLLSEVGSLIQKIKPCFMMSPRSIAQFCSPRGIEFDIVVFDEASQIPPPDALGAILRSKQMVVIGDTKQLPPTSFFDKVAEDDEDDDSKTSIKDVPSILHECKQRFSTKTLKWHYRSRHESLIAVSNQEFYDNKLIIFPSPDKDVEHLGLKFVHIDSAYDRGKSATNRGEAEAVVKKVFEHYQQYPDKSLGVGAFSSKQQIAIEDEFQNQLRNNPKMEKLFYPDSGERFFIKNLETIQGDERDVILLSIGYGKDSCGNLRLNFGPLNRERGENRLNVLITRAREKCVVFSNFRASDLQADTNSSVGVRALKVFLDYAENGNLHTTLSRGEDTESSFEDSVYEFLKEQGYEVVPQVGCAGYRIDLAVIDPSSHGRYLLGVECDGAQYHSSPTARDRDRLRQHRLEDLGWKIHRIWSTGWFRNRKDAQQRLITAVESAQKKDEVA